MSNSISPNSISSNSIPTSFSSFFETTTKYIPSFNVNKTLSESDKTLFVLVTQEDFKTQIASLDKELGGVISSALEKKEFKAESGECFAVFPANAITKDSNIDRVVLVSLGKKEEVSKEFDHLNALREAGAAISSTANGLKLESVALQDLTDTNGLGLSEAVFGIALRNYRFDYFFYAKKEGKGATLKNVNVVSGEDVAESIATQIKIAENVCLARDLVNYPPSDMNPVYYAGIVKGAFEGHSNISVKVLGEKEMADLGMNALLAVGKGSNIDSQCVIIEYKGNPDSSEFDCAFVGKGVCFDSGGLSIKPAQYMEDMKCDMGGSAAAFAGIRLVSALKKKVNIVAVLGLVENSVDAKSYKPGDILTSMSGQTIEVLNTDAEGRVVLSDCLYYTQKHYTPKYTVDLATLTGAIAVALGDIYAGLFTNDDDIADLLAKSAKTAGEGLWRLPMGKKFDKQVDSVIADVKNIGSGRGAGSTTAAQFLGRFVNCDKDIPETKWAHLDIAGVAYLGKSGTKVSEKGATGWGVTTLLEFASHFAK